MTPETECLIGPETEGPEDAQVEPTISVAPDVRTESPNPNADPATSAAAQIATARQAVHRAYFEDELNAFDHGALHGNAAPPRPLDQSNPPG